MKRGEAIHATSDINCLSCALLESCRDPRKKNKFACSFFIEMPELNKKGKPVNPSDADFLKMLSGLAKSESVVADSFNIDDGDLPLAPNFYRFCIGKKYLNSNPKPFPRQLQLGIKLFADACPVCSDKKWYREIPFDADVEEIPYRLSLYRHGVCPKCKRTRVENFENGSIDYDTLTCIAGQRSGKCVLDSSIISTPTGYKRMRDVQVGESIVVDGKSYPVSKVWKAKRKQCISLETDWGYSNVLTSTHPVYTLQGWQDAMRAPEVCVQTFKRDFISDMDGRKNRGAIAKAALRTFDSPKFMLDFLMLLPKQALIQNLRDAVNKEFVSNCELVLQYEHPLIADAVQIVLLGFGVLCRRVENKLVIAHPWAKTYAREIGVSRATAVDVYLSKRLSHDLLSSHVQKVIYTHMLTIKVDEWNHPKFKTEWVWAINALSQQTMTRHAASLFMLVVEQIRTDSQFARSTLYELLRVAISTDMIFLPVTVKRNTMQMVMDIEVPNATSFLANGIKVHNSTSIGLLFSYQTHMLLKLKNPSAFYKIKAGTILRSTIVAPTYGGAKANVWDPWMATIDDSPWFQNYFELLNSEASRRGEEELVKVNDTFIYFRNAGLYLSPASPSRRTLRGATRIAIIVDELGHFSDNTKLVNISGAEVWRALTRSLQTVRLAAYKLRKAGVVNIPNALAIAISSPWEVTDPIMTMYNKPTSKMYACIYPTWEFNPEMTFEFLQPEFESDEVSAWRDFGCRPPFSVAAFMSSVDPFRKIVGKRKPFVGTEPLYVKKKRNDDMLTTVKLKWRWEDDQVPKVMALDAGLTNNSFALSIFHLNEDMVPVCDGLVEIQPVKNRPVDFHRAYKDIMVPIIQRMNVKVLISDRWQSEKLMQDAEEDYGVLPLRFQLQYSDFTDWREATLRNEWILPRPEMEIDDIIKPTTDETAYFESKPVSKFIYQSLRVVDIPGKTVDKPSTGSDDLFRTVVLGWNATQLSDVAPLIHPGAMRATGSKALFAIAGQGGSGGKTTFGTNYAKPKIITLPDTTTPKQRLIGVKSFG